jgi:hypothetical protein
VEVAFVGVAQSVLPAARSILVLFVARLVVCKELDTPSGEIVDGEFGSRGTVLVDDLIVRAMGRGETTAALADPLLEVVAGDPVVFVECRACVVVHVACEIGTSERLPLASIFRALSRSLNASFQIRTTNFVLEAIFSDGSAGFRLIAAFEHIVCSILFRQFSRASTTGTTGGLRAAGSGELRDCALGGVVTIAQALHEGSIIRTCPLAPQPRWGVSFKRFTCGVGETSWRAVSLVGWMRSWCERRRTCACGEHLGPGRAACDRKWTGHHFVTGTHQRPSKAIPAIAVIVHHVQCMLSSFK